MSEYQYYEFQAIDRPLDERAMAALRAITSRARITPTSLVNEYQWGDFKGNPDKLMEQYFDAHFYLANWGTHRLMLRLPIRLFPFSSATPYCESDSMRAWATKTHVILDFNADSEGGYDDDEEYEGEGWLASLIPLRSSLMDGDLRCLYIGWLACLASRELDEDETEPPVPPGLGQLSAALTSLCDFLYVDEDLLEFAAEASADETPREATTEELASWIAQLKSAEKDRLLLRLLQGEGAHLSRELLQRFRADRTSTTPSAAEPVPRRTVGELLAAWQGAVEERERERNERAAQERAQQAEAEAKARARHLDSLAAREEAVWHEIEAAIKKTQPHQYDHAVQLLVDLRDLGKRQGTEAAVAKRIRQLRERHSNKPSLQERLDRAGMPR